nr:class I SAM-dependent methyltransferase [Alkalibacterium thalassium]
MYRVILDHSLEFILMEVCFMLQSALKFTHALLYQSVEDGDIVIDATVGNGNDTLLLADIVGPEGTVIGFDIQRDAISATQNRLNEADLNQRVQLIEAGHELVDSFSIKDSSIAAAVYNLGYLPKGDKSIITSPDTTIESLSKVLPLLKPGGLILIMVYYGHEGGAEEKEAVLSFAQSLPQKSYDVLQYAFINQKNSPPFLLAIEKK